MKKMNSFIILLFSILCSTVFSQFTVTSNSNASILAQQLAGSGVTITNPTIVCPTSAGVSFAGTFNNAPAGLGITDGIVLTTGLSTDLIDPTGLNFFASTSATAAGDSDLDALLTSLGESYTTNDACVLEFDIEVTGDSLKFNYAMGSEEYPTYVCGSVNDIFGFFISGPNPLGGTYNNQNIALIPGTTVPVSINTVNNGGSGSAATCYDGTYSSFMNSNPSPISSVDSIAYTELTQVLQAKAATVPCQTYHFKLAIADGGDWVFDSGVFLEAGSFTSNAVVIGASSVLGDGFNEAVEGCVDGVFSLRIDTAYSIDVMVGFDISGTATNGVDYITILDSVLILAGDTVIDIPIVVLADALVEGTETVILTPYTACGTLGAPSILDIIDYYPHSAMISDTLLCDPGMITLTGTGAQYYHWRDSTLLLNFDSAVAQSINPINQTTTFYMDGVLGTCSFIDTVSVVVSQSDPLVVIDEISCIGANDGQIYVIPNANADLPFSYNFIFSGGVTTDSILSNIAPGLQIMNVNDSLGCLVATAIHTFVDPAVAIFSYDSIPISCAGANDGSLCLYDIADGTYFAYLDTNGVRFDSVAFTMNADTFCFGPLGPGVYDMSFTNDTTGCSGSFTASLTEPMGMAFSYDTTNLSCVNSADGNICIYNVLNGIYTANVVYEGVPMPPVSFSINSDTFCMGTLPAGHYDINLVNNSTLCNANFSADLTEPDTLIVNMSSVGASLCAGGSIDSLVTSVTGGTQAYQYLWNTTDVTPYLLSPTPGFYTVVVTDQNGCQDSTSVTLVSPVPMYLNIEMDSVICAGDPSGTAYVDSVSGGTAPYNYLWNDAATQSTDTAFNILAGQVILTVLDFNLCQILDTVDVLEPNNPLGLTLASNLITCFGGDTCIDATISGGTTPYTFLWNDALNQTTEDICGLVTGTYILTVTDVKGCMKIDSITILENPEIVLSMDSTNIICYGMAIGDATVTAVGGSGTYTYLWNDALAQTTAMASNLIAGTYTVVVSDQIDVNCFQSLSVTIEEPTDSILIILDSIQDVLCYSGSTGAIHVSVSGGTIPYIYAWTNGGAANEDLTNEEAGIYTFTVTDNNNCSMSLTDSISQPADSILITLSTNVISCFGGDTCIDATVSGGSAPYTYLWNDALGQATEDVCGLVAGSYTLTVTDNNDCIKTKTILITEVTEITLTIDSTNIDCFGDADGVATVSAVGGSGTYTYLWNDVLAQTTAIATALVPGVYTVLVSDANDVNCSQSISVNITEPDSALSANLDNVVDVICFGASTGEINVNVAGGTSPYTYAWTNGSLVEDLNGAPANNYTLTIIDANLCLTTYADVISQPSILAISVVNTTAVSCFGGNDGAIDISVTGGTGAYTYSWNGGATTQDVTGLTFGTHQVTVTDSNNCVATQVVQLIQPADVIISFNYSDYNGVNVSCNGSVDGTVEAVVVAGGSAPFTYAWDNGMTGNPITGIAANTAIIVTITDNNLCSYTQAITPLSEPVLLSLTKDSTNVSCAGYNDGTATAIPSGGTAPYTYLWSNALTTNVITGLAPNTYTCNVTTANGCTESIQVLITEAEAIVVTTIADSVKCWGDSDGSIIVNASGGNGNAFQYSIDDGLTYQAGSVFADLDAGVYADIVVKQDGTANCVSVAVSQIVAQPDPMFIFINPADTTIQIQESVPLTIMVDPATGYFSGGSYSTIDITSIVWSPTIGLSCTDCINPSVLTYEQSNDYVATVTYSPYACLTTATATIQVENNLMYFVPNGFSPQGDGINDEFLVYGEALKNFNLIIFNRWGEKVFETNIQSKGWDGTFKGVLQNSGVFSYHLNATYLDDKEISTKGSITLIR